MQDVAVSVMDVVNVIVVRNRFVSTILTVGVLINAVLGDGAVLVVVIAVEGVVVVAVDIVDVIAVLDSFVSAVLAVLMLGDGVFSVLFGHGVLLRDEGLV